MADKNRTRELPPRGRIGELLRPSGQFNFMADKNSARELPFSGGIGELLRLQASNGGKMERENSHLAAELENFYGLRVSIILRHKTGARELPSSGRIGELLRASGQYNFMAEKWSERTPIWRRNWRTSMAFGSV
jgi:hypothetical protein